jgi:hypothetical protein
MSFKILHAKEDKVPGRHKDDEYSATQLLVQLGDGTTHKMLLKISMLSYGKLKDSNIDPKEFFEELSRRIFNG